MGFARSSGDVVKAYPLEVGVGSVRSCVLGSKNWPRAQHVFAALRAFQEWQEARLLGVGGIHSHRQGIAAARRFLLGRTEVQRTERRGSVGPSAAPAGTSASVVV